MPGAAAICSDNVTVALAVAATMMQDTRLRRVQSTTRNSCVSFDRPRSYDRVGRRRGAHG